MLPRHQLSSTHLTTDSLQTYALLGWKCNSPQVGYFHGYIDGVDFVFVDHPAFHYVADSIYSGDRQAITWRCALLCKVTVLLPPMQN